MASSLNGTYPFVPCDVYRYLTEVCRTHSIYLTQRCGAHNLTSTLICSLD